MRVTHPVEWGIFLELDHARETNLERKREVRKKIIIKYIKLMLP